ncbi:MAG: hypothetical protein AABX24_04570, partial [Nanoarchaeota archaeon]
MGSNVSSSVSPVFVLPLLEPPPPPPPAAVAPVGVSAAVSAEVVNVLNAHAFSPRTTSDGALVPLKGPPPSL